MQNLAQYNMLTPNTTTYSKINGVKINTVLGSGMHDLPGGWSSLDRFVRVATFVRYVANVKTSIDGIIAATHILDNVAATEGLNGGFVPFIPNYVYDITHWSTIKDLRNLIFYYRNSDGVLRAINLNKINFDTNTQHRQIIIKQSYPFILDETHHL